MTVPLEGDARELEILKHHIQKGEDGIFALKNIRQARKTYGYSYEQLNSLLWKLNFLTLIYELEVVAFNL